VRSGFRCEVGRQFAHAVVEVRVVDDLVDQSTGTGFRCVDAFAEENEPAGGVVAGHLGESLGAAPGRDDAEVDLGPGDQCPVGGDTEITRKREFTATSKCIPVDGRDDRGRKRLKRDHHLLAQFTVGVCLRDVHVDHLCDIGPSDKCVLAGAGHD